MQPLNEGAPPFACPEIFTPVKTHARDGFRSGDSLTAAIPRRFRPSPDALASRAGDEIVLVHTGTDQIFALNATGARVWELLCEQLDQTEIEAHLALEYDVSRAELRAQVGELIASLLQGSLIVVVSDG